ncbi:MAG: hypothetical protein ACR2MQ_04555 [Gemmatimonadaceae bacterium]
MKRGPLTFEHVPPRSAFNDRPVLALTDPDFYAIGPDDPVRGRVQQRRSGKHTLCATCNAKLGRWYVETYKQWARDGAVILQQSSGIVSLVHLNHLLPLRILKQVAAMFFSINPVGFAEKHPELAHFVLSPHSQLLPRKLRFFVYYNCEGRYRTVPICALLDIKTKQMSVFTELCYPPFGFVMAVDTPPPDDRLCEITAWARFKYSEFASLPLSIPVLPTYTFIGGDYRTKARIYEEA